MRPEFSLNAITAHTNCVCMSEYGRERENAKLYDIEHCMLLYMPSVLIWILNMFSIQKNGSSKKIRDSHDNTATHSIAQDRILIVFHRRCRYCLSLVKICHILECFSSGKTTTPALSSHFLFDMNLNHCIRWEHSDWMRFHFRYQQRFHFLLLKFSSSHSIHSVVFHSAKCKNTEREIDGRWIEIAVWQQWTIDEQNRKRKIERSAHFEQTIKNA